MSSLVESLGKMLAGSAMKEISRSAGLNESSTGKAVSMALPILMGALSRNASRGGSEDLLGALSRDHDGSILDNLSGYLNSSKALEDEGILGHMLGGRRRNVESSIGRASGIDAATVASILKILAPIIMGAVGRERRTKNMDAGSLLNLLNQESTDFNRSSSSAGGAIGQLLDSDGDGDVDLADLQRSGITDLIGGFLK